MLYFLKFPLVDTLAGAEFHTLKLAQYFRKTGHGIKVITSDAKLFRLFEQRRLPRRRVFIGWEPTAKWSILLWPITYLLARARLKKIIRQAPPDSIFFCQSLIEKLILTPHLTSPTRGEEFPSLDGRGKGRVIWIEHKIPGPWLKLNPLKFLYLKYARKVQIITVSRFAKQEFLKLGVPEKNIEVIYPTTSPSVIASSDALIGAKQSQFIIGILSRLSAEKGVLDFLNTILPALHTHQDWKILIAGEGPEKEKIKQTSQIKLLGFVHDLDNFFSQISVLAYPSLVPESFGLAALEAQSRGVPVVASNLGALPEIITHGENGYLIPSPGGGEGLGEVKGEVTRAFSPPHEGETQEGVSWVEYLEQLETPSTYHSLSATALLRAQTFSEEKMFEAFNQFLKN